MSPSTKRLRVGILFGGRSAEHEVSILSARNVLLALDRTRFEPVLIGIDKRGRWLPQRESLLLGAAEDVRVAKVHDVAPPVAIEPGAEGGALVPLPPVAGEPEATGTPVAAERRRQSATPDVIFPVLHGPMGEDGTVQGLLELAGIPFVGAGVLGSAVGMDKDAMKRLLRDAGLPIGEFRTIRKVDFERDPEAAVSRASEVGFPQFTKPANLGSSVGIRRVAARDELCAALAHAFEFDEKALAEAAIEGREIEVSVLGNDDPQASLPGEVRVAHADGFYSYDAKYVDENGAELDIPARLTPEQTGRVRDLAVAAFRTLECAGMARVDFFLTPDGQFLINEINTLPGFTAISMYPKLWEATGIPPTELVTRLIELALERHERRRKVRSALP